MEDYNVKSQFKMVLKTGASQALNEVKQKWLGVVQA